MFRIDLAGESGQETIVFHKALGWPHGVMGCCYLRHMDDWVVLAATRWKLRAALRAVNEVIADLCVRQHPDKTIIGRIARGFDFLGYR